MKCGMIAWKLQPTTSAGSRSVVMETVPSPSSGAGAAVDVPAPRKTSSALADAAISLPVGTITVDKPVVTNWHTFPKDPVPAV